MATEKTQHPEWEKENSLTSPEDRDLENKWRPEQGAAQLDESEVKEAMNELNNTSFVERHGVQPGPDQVPRIDKHTLPSVYKLGLNLMVGFRLN